MSTTHSSRLRRRLLSFFGLTYLITWSAWGAVIVLGFDAAASPILNLIGGVGPLIAAGLLSWRRGALREWVDRAVRWRVPARWWLAAILLPVALSLTGYALYLGFTGASLGLTSDSVPVVYATVFLLVFFLQGGYGEEMGWRGYALPTLLEGYHALTAGLIVGVVWAVWHLPQFFIQDSSQGGSFLLYLAGVVGLSVILTWLFVNARRSVLLVVVFHAQWNVFESGVLFEFAAPLGLAGPASSTAVIWLFALFLIARYGRDLQSGSGHPGRRRQPGPAQGGN